MKTLNLSEFLQVGFYKYENFLTTVNFTSNKNNSRKT